ncbi:YqhV family protein [Brevibacillus dissolubilis]|uniref:YqhV family protein n=1 Tax=Brevibacillus dissolubilis TaxID=1844116 RepID=UPI0011178BEB|nr:YqhV family protein [Brevibacillus dissolubilis]
MFEKAIIGMASLRIMSGTIEILAALLILRFNSVEKALVINSGLALVGPLVLLTTTTIGLLGMSDRLSMGKMFWIFAGIACIFIGVRGK